MSLLVFGRAFSYTCKVHVHTISVSDHYQEPQRPYKCKMVEYTPLCSAVVQFSHMLEQLNVVQCFVKTSIVFYVPLFPNLITRFFSGLQIGPFVSTTKMYTLHPPTYVSMVPVVAVADLDI